MIKSIEGIIEKAKSMDMKKMSVAVSQDIDVLEAIVEAKKLRITDSILVGNKEETQKIAKENNIDIEGFEIIDIKDLNEATNKAVQLVADGEADMVMKGLVDTSIFLKNVLIPEMNLRTGRTISGIYVCEIEGYDRLFAITDPAINIDPDLQTKKQLIENSIQVSNALGIDIPKVAVLCAKEKVNPKMPTTVDAKELEEMNKRGEIEGCVVGGPFALDNIVSVEAAKQKGINHIVAGFADTILAPNIETANSLVKSITYFSRSKSAGAVVGTKKPIIITSRADTKEDKLNTIALSALMSN